MNLRRLDQQTLTLTAIAVVVSILVLGPILVLLRASFSPPGTLPFDNWGTTLVHYASIFTNAENLRLAANTLLYALGSVSIGVAIATAIAWATERTDMPGRISARVMMFSWMSVPPLVMGFGWILLVNPGNGALNVLAKYLFGLSGPMFTIYSMWALVLITALAVVPTSFVMISGLMRNMDPQLEQAASVHGATGAVIARRITLPLAAPGVLSVSIFMFMAVVQAFDLPLIIGLTARIPVLSTRVYLLSSPDAGIPNYGLSSAFGVLLLAVAALLMWGYFRAVRVGEKFRVVTGRGFRPKRVALGAWRWPVCAAVMFYFVLMLLPLAMLAWASLFTSYRLPGFDELGGATLASYARVLHEGRVQRAIGNTLLMVLGSASIVMVLSCLIAWFSVRGRSVLARYVDVLSFAPTAVPPIVMVMAILMLYLQSPLYGTVWILILGHVTIYIAFGTRSMGAALMQIHKELADAASISGADWFTGLRRITLPLVWPQILNGWLWVVAHSARDLTIPLVLMTTGNVVIASALWQMWDFPDLPGAAALAMLLVAGLLVVVVPLQIYAARQSDAAH
ncbi:MAG: ABC transporter permease subunit [Burkholderiaceae bacterium]